MRPATRARTDAWAAVWGLMALATAAPLHAQTGPATAPEPPAAQQARAALQEPLGVSPGGAFVRSLLLPGWGHVAIGSYSRGGFYFALETATAYTFFRTRHRLSEARERVAFRESFLRADLAGQGVTDEEEIQAALDGDPILTSYQSLAESRRSQNEDLVAWGIFLLFLSGADAYVSAHLARFPEPIEVQVTPVASDRAEVGLRIPLPNLP
ncbi:MAG: DUF5683 domain-containing protein [Gemmatimonadota bacterium]